MTVITLTYFSNNNEICLSFNGVKSDKYTYSIYGNDGFVLKGLVETNLIVKPKVIFNIESNTDIFVKVKEIDKSSINETVRFVNIDHLKQKNNLNMLIIDKDTDTLFKSITEDCNESVQTDNSSSNIDSILNSIKLEASDNSNSSESDNESNSDIGNQSYNSGLIEINSRDDYDNIYGGPINNFEDE